MPTKEEIEKNRAKELAVIKASNEMLENAKASLIERDDVAEGVIGQIEAAQRENLLKAKNVYNASKEEVESMKYHGPSIGEVKKYERRLERKGLNDELIHRKQILTATAAGTPKDDESSKFKQNKRTKKGVGYVGDNITDETETETANVEEPKDDTKPKKTKKVKVVKKQPKEEPVEEKNETEDDELEIVTPKEISEKIKKNSNLVETAEEKKQDEFNFKDIPSYVQFDIIPLPSNGECYPHKKNRIPVAYLTASDENIIASPNIYRDGNLMDILLERKILDKSIKVSDLCVGDRDAIVLWLRATSYGVDFPIITTHPTTQKKYEVNVKLDSFKYKPFDLKGDEKGLFEYKTKNGDIIKFKFLTPKDEEELRDSISNEIYNVESVHIYRNSLNIIEAAKRIVLKDDLQNDIIEAAQSIVDALDNVETDDKEEATYIHSITKQMKVYTVSVNGNEDREFVDRYIENMRAGEALAYRNYLLSNRPGMDLTVHVDVPESDGGGSFDTTFRIGDSIFYNF